MNTKLNIVVLLLISICMVNCYYDNEEELYGTDNCDTDNVSYASFVDVVLSQNCYVCHSAASNQGGVTLEGYDALKIFVDNGRFSGAITHASGFSPMPQNAPKLLACQLDKIQAWIDDGAQNN